MANSYVIQVGDQRFIGPCDLIVTSVGMAYRYRNAGMAAAEAAMFIDNAYPDAQVIRVNLPPTEPTPQAPTASTEQPIEREGEASADTYPWAKLRAGLEWASKPQSPHNLIQEMVVGDDWRVVVASMIVSRLPDVESAHATVWRVLKRYPTADMMWNGSPTVLRGLLSLSSRPTRLAYSIKMMSSQWLEGERLVGLLYGCGEYEEDAYAIFCDNADINPVAQDLRDYVQWRRQFGTIT